MSRASRGRNGGFTIVEVMVFSVVSLVLIGLLASLFIMATRRTEDSRLRVDLQQTALFALKKIETELSRSSIRSIAASDGDYYIVSTTGVVGWDGAPDIIWSEQQTAFVFNPAKKTLHYEVVEKDASELSEELTRFRPYLPTSAELQAIAGNSSGAERVLSTHVEGFKLTDRSGNSTQFQSMPLKLELKFRRPLSTSDRHAEFTIERRYTLRNTF